jgi:hypothetical protein
MIPLSTALNCFALLDDRSLRLAVTAAIFEGRHVGALGVRDAQPEDIFFPILAAPQEPRRVHVIAGCRDVCVRLYSALSELAAGEEVEKQVLADTAEHFSALLGATKPPELAAQVRSLLEAALDPAISTSVREPLVQLAVSYAVIDPRPEYWQDHVQGDCIPGHAFQALRRIDPRHPRLEGFLAHLWQRSLRGELSLRLPFYVQTWAKEQASPDEAIRRLVSATVRVAPDLREELRADCVRYQHSAAWADYLPDFAVEAPRIIKRSSYNPNAILPVAIRAWFDQLGVATETSDVNSDQQILGCGVPNFDVEFLRKIIPSGPMVSCHSLIIQNTTDEALDEVVKTTLKRTGTNLISQIGGKPSQQNIKILA